MLKIIKRPTRQQFEARLTYDPDTGFFARKAFVSGDGKLHQADAGRPILANRHPDGYITISVYNWPHLAHRVAYVMMTGEWPKALVDHANGDRRDNRWCNLRAATRRQNNRNRKLKSTNTSGHTGVSWCKDTSTWRATITPTHRKAVSIGRYDTIEEAIAAYRAAALEYFGEFTRHSEVRRAENQPTTELTLYAGIYCKRWTIPNTGMLLPQHSHSYDHLTYVVSGSVRVYRNDQYRGDYYAPSVIRIPARQKHHFQSLEDNVVLLCLHNMDHAEADGEPPIHEDNSLPED